jgi:predicted site-specific integrase-resolvase
VNPTPIPPKLKRSIVPITEATAALSVGKTTIYRWFKDGILHPVKLPNCRSVFVSVAEIEKLLADALENAV